MVATRKNEIRYGYIQDTKEGEEIFAAFEGLPFAERMLVIVEPLTKHWAVCFIRDYQGNLHILDDLEGKDDRKYRNKMHLIESLKDAVLGSQKTNVTGFVDDMSRHYYNGGRIGHGPFWERRAADTPYLHLCNLANDWRFAEGCHARKGRSPFMVEFLQERIDRLFEEHLGLDFQDFLDDCKAGTRGRKAVGVPVKDIPLCPVTKIPAISATRGAHPAP
ncbi:MAG: hypothetical protein KGI97_06660 [Alphaproteobacteria bacterium]|nr:hypothetical protein [Alphaproteobacteria bacterium]